MPKHSFVAPLCDLPMVGVDLDAVVDFNADADAEVDVDVAVAVGC